MQLNQDSSPEEHAEMAEKRRKRELKRLVENREERKIETKYNQQPVNIELEKFIVGAEEDIISDENGESYLKVVEAGTSGPHNHFLKIGEVSSIHNVLFALNKPNLTPLTTGKTFAIPNKKPFIQDTP